MTAQTRTYLYGVAVAAIPILVTIGAIAPDQAALWLNLAAAILGLGTAGTALANRPTLTASERDRAAAVQTAAINAVNLIRAEAPVEQISAAVNALAAQVRA